MSCRFPRAARTTYPYLLVLSEAKNNFLLHAEHHPNQYYQVNVCVPSTREWVMLEVGFEGFTLVG